MAPNDFTSPREGDWSEYARLVLAELERHNRLLSKMDEKLDAIKIDQALYEREVAQIKVEIAELKVQISHSTNRILMLENTGLADATIKKYRKWILGAVFTLLVSVAIPLVDLAMKVSGS